MLRRLADQLDLTEAVNRVPFSPYGPPAPPAAPSPVPARKAPAHVDYELAIDILAGTLDGRLAVVPTDTAPNYLDRLTDKLLAAFFACHDASTPQPVISAPAASRAPTGGDAWSPGSHRPRRTRPHGRDRRWPSPWPRPGARAHSAPARSASMRPFSAGACRAGPAGRRP